MDDLIHISDKPLNTNGIIELVGSSKAGAIDVFIGTVRDVTENRNVEKLIFESFDSMALKEMTKIADLAMKKWPILKVAIHHRKGVLEIGDVAVVIAVSSAHRVAAFEACKFAIDTLKETVPIWKKEVFEDGEVWVAAHP